MSSTVDNRVVEMGFNNKQFETNVKQSTDSLDKLKKSLDLSESAKGITALSAAGRNFSLSHMGASLDNISSKFSAMGAIGFTVFQNLTNMAIDFGKKLVSSLTSPIRQGLSEYETQINAIQTIMANTASKGTTLEQVNAALDQLNEYSDKTIYNFTEMARNIGTFTAAGVDLNTSVNAIKGIANLAAVSGSSSQQAATGMYQLSQAISAGTVRLMDWNSVTNAGMGGAVFQEALMETARVHGIAIDDMIKKSGSFRLSLEENWLSSEVLLETLSKFTGDLTREQLLTMGYTEEQITGIISLGKTANDAATKVKTFSQLMQTLQESMVSGWAQSFRIVLGDFEEAKVLFTEISDTLGPMIQRSSEARNKILQQWKDWGGRTLIIDALRDSFNGLLSIAAPITKAFREVFPPRTLEILKSLTMAVWLFSQRLQISGVTAWRLHRIFKGIFSVFALVVDIISALVKSFLSLTSGISVSGDGILEFLAKIGDFLVGLREGVDVNEAFKVAVEKIKEVLDTAKTSVIKFANTVNEKFREVREWFSGLFKDVDTTGVENFFTKIQIRFKPLTALAKLGSLLIGGLLKLAPKLAPVLFKAASALGKFLMQIGSALIEGISNINLSKVFDIINSGLMGAIMLAIRKFILSGSGALDQVGGMFTGITGILDGVRGSLQAWQQNLKAKTLLTIAFAIGILALSLIALAGIDSAKLTMALGAITGLFVDLISAMSIMGKMGGGGLLSSLSLVALSVSLLILAAALDKVASIDAAGVDQGLKAIFAMTAGLVIFSKVMSKETGNILKGSISLIAFALSMTILVGVVEKLGNMDPAALSNGLLGIGIMLAEIAAFMRIVNGSKMGAGSGIAILGMAAAILVLSISVEKFGEMDVAKMQQGLIAIGIVFAEIAAFIRLSGNGKGMITTAVGMAILSGAMYILVDVISKLSDLSWEELAKGLVGMGGALLIIVAAVRAMPKNMLFNAVALVAVAFAIDILAKALGSMGGMSWEEIGRGLLVLAGSLGILVLALYAMSGTLVGSLALMVAATALMMLTPVLTTLGAMPLSEIGMALLALAGVFLLLGIAGALLTPVVPTLLGLGVSMMLIGVAVALIGVGLLAFSAGLTAIAVSGMAAAVAIVGMISVLLGIIPLVIQTLINTIIIFAEGIIAATPVVAEAITTLLLSVLQIIIDVSPKLFEALDILLKGLIKLIDDNAPGFISAILTLLVTLLEKIAEKLPDFLQAGFDILIKFLEGIRDNIGEVVTVVSEIIVEFLNAVADNLPDIIQAGFDLMLDFINGLSDSVDKNGEAILTAVGELAGNIIDSLVRGLVAGAGEVLDALVGLALDAFNAAKAALGFDSPSKLFIALGKSIPQGMVVGVNKLAHLIPPAIRNLANKAVDGMSGIRSSINDALTSNLDMNPTIRPVVDMSKIVASGKLVDDLFGEKSLDLMPIMVTTGSIASSIDGNNVDSEGRFVRQGATIKFEQNNYSPKALTRIEIYRQTNNQLRALKGFITT